MNWQRLPVAALLGLAVALPAAVAAQGTSAPLQYAQAQSQPDRDTRSRPKKAPAAQPQRQPARTQQRTRERQPAAPRTRAIQERNRVQQQRRMPQRDAPAIRQRYDWNQYRPGQAPRDRSNYTRFDPRSWQRNITAQQRYRWRAYQRPRGWYYRRWAFGMVLPTLFWTRDYWLTDYWQFGLMNPPYGYVWVRYGDDAMLVNVRTGLILRVEYGLFY